MKLKGAMLFVKDFARMREFYANMLQAQPMNTEWTDSFAHFDLGGAGFSLHAIPEEHARDIEIASPARAREQSPVKIIFLVKDVPSERLRLEAMGITMLPRPWQNPAESCDGMDLEGNVFQITSDTR